MKVRKLPLAILISFLSVAFGFVPHLPRGCLLDEASSRLSYRPHNYILLMAIKSTDIEKKQPEDDSLPGVSRFAIMGNIFRGNKDEEKEETKVEGEEAGFFKNISKRLTFRRESETANGFEVSGDKQAKKPHAFLRMIGISGGDAQQTEDTAMQLAELQKQKELNRKRQLAIAKQKVRDKNKEKVVKEEEKRIVEQIAEVEAEQQREEARRQKEQAKLEAVRKKEEERKQKELAKLEAERKRDRARMLKKERALAAEDTPVERTRDKTTSVAAKFIMNVWNTTTSAFSSRDDYNEEWVQLLPKSRIEPGEIVPVQIQGIDLLVVASRDGKVHCLANSCSHMGTPLDTGRLESRPTQDASGQKVLPNSSPPNVEFEDCIVCPLHHTAFALESGEVRGPWCPYPPVLGALTGTVKKTSPVATFDIRTKGKFIEVRINSPIDD